MQSNLCNLFENLVYATYGCLTSKRIPDLDTWHQSNSPSNVRQVDMLRWIRRVQTELIFFYIQGISTGAQVYTNTNSLMI